jgi:hypothetical protein
MDEESYSNSDTELEQGSSQKKIKLNETRGGSKIRSWIWKYFEPIVKEGTRHAVCQVEIVNGKKCEKTYKIGTSTSNCATHLENVHEISEQLEQEANVVSSL